MAVPPAPSKNKANTLPPVRNGIAAPTRSARKIKKGVSSHGTDVTHTVRVTVLGLAGITVDRSKCNENTKDGPPPPSKMKAVVAFSRNSVIRGTTSLSKPLARSPNDDILMTGSSDKSRNGKDDDTYATSKLESTRLQRHVAVWASDNATLGSLVTFNANLHRSSSAQKSTASSAFAPMSYELTIALTEDERQESKVALPFGIATLAISGDECISGRPVKIDLPVLRLQDAKPLSSKGYPMIKIAPKQMTECNQKKKSKLVRRLFKRNGGKGQPPPSAPSADAQAAFASAYTMDADGDAIIRVSLEIYEKGSELERHFLDRHARGESVSTMSSVDSSSKQVKTDSPYDEAHAADLAHFKSNRRNLRPIQPGDKYDGPSDEDEDSASECTGDRLSDAGTSYDGTDSFVSTDDDNVAFFHWSDGRVKQGDSDSMATDQYTLSFEKKSIERERPDDEMTFNSFSVFGTSFRMQTCGAMEGDSNILKEIQDDMTHVTADFFGKSYKVPMCSAFVPQDDESLMTMDQTQKEPRVSVFVGKISERFCQGTTPKDDLDLSINDTFSTLSDGPKIQEFTPATTVKDFLKQNPRTAAVKPPPAATGDMSIVGYEVPAYAGNKTLLESRSDGGELVDQHRTEQDSTEKRSTTDVSPKTVLESIPNFSIRRGHALMPVKTPPCSDYTDLEKMMESSPPKPKRLKAPKSFVDIFNCRVGKCSELDDGLRYEPYQTEVPPLVVPKAVDDMSIGDLTATTHEMQIATDSCLLEIARRQYHNVDKQERKGAQRMKVPLPVAFGGDGICIGMGVCTGSTESGPFRVQSDDGNSIVMKRIPDKHKAEFHGENYFAEYEDQLVKL